jgi:hypothetical protein
MRDPQIKDKMVVQVIWGIALVLAGLGVFYRIPEVMLKIEKVEQFAANDFIIRFCLYVLGILLVSGGTKKIYEYVQKPNLRRLNKPQKDK